MSFSLKGRHWIVIFSLLAVIGLGIAGLVLTRDDNTSTEKSNAAKRRGPVVDQGPLQTARQLAATASGRDEQRLARQAVKAADHAIDLAFATALREAASGTANTMPALLEAVRAYATIGEMCDTLREVWGEYQEQAII